MKKAILSLLIVAILSSFTLISFTEVVSAIKAGNAAEVAKYFDNTVEITVAQKTNSYSKKQAELVLSDFFQTNSVKSFDVIHQSENSASQYCIGNLTTINGVYRTTIFMKQKGNKQVIQELRFEK
jgi:type II secretory pathway pseudopilin PulG